MCYFELDGDAVLARTNLTGDLPEDLLEMCVDGSATVISSSTQVPL
jgi:hypothetical protein